MRIAIIPARGGSKRISKKNIRDFFGVPMLVRAIKTANLSGLFDQVVVSTECQQIASLASSHGAAVPFFRPENLADDFTPTVPVIAHAISECEKLGWQINEVCCIYPCTPFLTFQDLIQGYELLKSTIVDYTMAIAEFPASPIRALIGNNIQNCLSPMFNHDELVRTQDIPVAYYDVGQFYWGKRKAWFENNRIHSNALGVIFPRIRAIDIDTEEDWLFAETVFKFINNEKV